MSAGITILGLGPSSAEMLTRQAWEILGASQDLYVRTRNHPALEALPETISIHAFDHIYNEANSFSEVYAAIVHQLMALGRREQGVVYAVPGDPGVGEATVARLLDVTAAEGLPLRLIHGVSFIEPCLALLELDALDGLYIADALELAAAHHPAFPPDKAVLVAQLHSQLVAADVKLTLLNQYPPDHPVKIISNAGSTSPTVAAIQLEAMDRDQEYLATTSLYIPPWDGLASFEAFQETIAHLRAPEGCPWDREQTHLSLRSHLMEETFEALDAIDQGDMPALKEELGDLLLQIVIQVQIATEEGSFLMVDVIQHIQDKLIHRHPHVFADLDVADVDEVLHNWEAIKEKERDHQGTGKGILDGVPLGMPALAQADEIQARVARVGFDWTAISDVVEKLHEELQEVAEADSEQEQLLEMGDLLFSVVNYARWLKVDPEAALRQANRRFRDRFGHVQEIARTKSVNLSELSIDELEHLWQKAKEKYENK